MTAAHDVASACAAHRVRIVLVEAESESEARRIVKRRPVLSDAEIHYVDKAIREPRRYATARRSFARPSHISVMTETRCRSRQPGVILHPRPGRERGPPGRSGSEATAASTFLAAASRVSLELAR
jgi:hypothetical protein